MRFALDRCRDWHGSLSAGCASRGVPVRMRPGRLRTAAGVCVAAMALMAGIVQACSVPVFRYALDHWMPDAYRIHILHRRELTEEQAQLVAGLKAQTVARFANAVVEVGKVDDVADPVLQAVIDKSEIQDQPLCVLQGPTETPGVYRDVWSGPFTPETGAALLGSPLRDRIVRMLLDGTSVVWVYLDSGVKPVDDANFSMLEAELQRLERELELPEIDAADLQELSTSPDDVKLKLAAVRLSRDAPEEAALVQMLLSSEPDLRDATLIAEPMAFPVFGRGRILYSLVGQGITPELIETASRFLSGSCQCTVKAQNPGVDLLLAVDWDGLISPSAPTEVNVTLTGLAGFQSDQAATAALTPVVAATEPAHDADLDEAPPQHVPDPQSAATLVRPREPAGEPVEIRRTVDVTLVSWPVAILGIMGVAAAAVSIILIRRR